MPRWVWLVALVLVVGCGDGAGSDAGPPDASRDAARPSDAGADDAASSDAGDDAGVPEDAPTPIDASTGGPDTGVREVCNLFDDDLDGRVDEGACRVCRTCTPCEVTEREGHVLLQCSFLPGINAVEAWQGVCEQVGHGYRLLDVDSTGEAIWAESVTGERDSLVGIRRFGLAEVVRDSTGAARDESSLRLDPEATRLPDDRCYVQTGAGLVPTVCLNAIRYTSVLCEGAIVTSASELCVPSTETCDATDEDCDGKIDEGSCPDDCFTRVFVDHVYRVCSGSRDWPSSRTRCQSLDSDLTMLDSDEEGQALYAFGVQFARAYFWVGMENVAGDGGVLPQWIDGRVVGSAEAPFARWGAGQPSAGLDEAAVVAIDGRSFTFVPQTSDRYSICESPVAPGP